MASPFALYIRSLRMRNEMTQADLAHATGYEQAHMSSLELGTKNPTAEFLVRLAQAFEFSEEDHQEMMAEVAASKSRFFLSPDQSAEKFRLCSELWEKIDRIHPATVTSIRGMLQLEDQVAAQPRHQPDRLRRNRAKETSM